LNELTTHGRPFDIVTQFNDLQKRNGDVIRAYDEFRRTSTNVPLSLTDRIVFTKADQSEFTIHKMSVIGNVTFNEEKPPVAKRSRSDLESQLKQFHQNAQLLKNQLKETQDFNTMLEIRKLNYIIN